MAEQPSPPASSNLPDESPLTLADCVRVALESNPRTRSAWLAAQGAAANVGVRKSANYPVVSVSGSSSVSDMGNLERRENAIGWGLSGRFSVGYLLFDGGAREGQLEGALADLRAADFRHQTVLLDVAFAVQEAWYVLQGALWYEDAVIDLLAQAEAQLRLARARFEVGLGRKYDVAQAEAKLAEVQRLEVVARSQIRQSRGQLARAMGLDIRTQVPVVKTPAIEVTGDLGNVDLFMDRALKLRPELGEAKARVESALADSIIADSGRYPSITVDGGVGAGYDTRSNVSIPWSAGIGVTMPLFDGHEVHYERRRADYAEKQAREELRDEVDQVQFEVWAAHVQAGNARAGIVATHKVLEAAEASVSLAEGNYQQGLGTIVEVFIAQAELADARLNLVQARLDWFLGVARLERAVGIALEQTRPSEVP
jgi:outer membrane protein